MCVQVLGHQDPAHRGLHGGRVLHRGRRVQHGVDDRGHDRRLPLHPRTAHPPRGLCAHVEQELGDAHGGGGWLALLLHRYCKAWPEAESIFLSSLFYPPPPSTSQSQRSRFFLVFLDYCILYCTLVQ